MTRVLWAVIWDKLTARWSPEQICVYLRRCFPDNQSMNPCVETIYQSIFIQAKGALRKEIASLMRQGRTRRRPAVYSRQVRPRFKDPMVMISQRPASVEDRAVPGHWEGDLIIGAKGRSAVGTLVERSTRYTLLLYLPNGHSAAEVQDAVIAKLAGLPDSLRLSLTWDQGSEFGSASVRLLRGWGLRCIFVIRIRLGSVVLMRTRMGCCVSICLRGLICRFGLRGSLM